MSCNVPHGYDAIATPNYDLWAVDLNAGSTGKQRLPPMENRLGQLRPTLTAGSRSRRSSNLL